MPGARRKPQAPSLARDDGRALERYALGQEHGVPDLSASRRHQRVLAHLAQHGPDHDGPRQARRHLGVATHQCHAHCHARLCHLGEELLHVRFLTLALGQEHGGEKPARRRPAHGQVVGVDVQRVPAHLVGGEGDGIGRRHEIAIAHVQDGGVLADLRAHDHSRIGADVLAEESLEELGGKLAHGQRRHDPRSIGAAAGMGKKGHERQG